MASPEGESHFFVKFLTSGGQSPVVYKKWPLPRGDRPGEWFSVKGRLVMCKNGLHFPAKGCAHEWVNDRLFVAEVKGLDKPPLGSSKVVARHARLLFEVDMRSTHGLILMSYQEYQRCLKKLVMDEWNRRLRGGWVPGSDK